MISVEVIKHWLLRFLGLLWLVLWLEAQVLAAVQSQALGAREAHTTEVTHVGPLPSVQSHVVLQARRSGEVLTTVGTVELLSAVDLLVLPEAPGLVEGAWADLAQVGPLPCVGEPVAVHGSGVGEALAAVGTGERPLPRVDLEVARELAPLGELFTTVGAAVGFLSGVDTHVHL